MDKAEAIKDIVNESRREYTTNAGAQRVANALRVLRFGNAEIISVLSYLDICKADGTPYVEKVRRTW